MLCLPQAPFYFCRRAKMVSYKAPCIWWILLLYVGRSFDFDDKFTFSPPPASLFFFNLAILSEELQKKTSLNYPPALLVKRYNRTRSRI